jgi:hypothetical protein
MLRSSVSKPHTLSSSTCAVPVSPSSLACAGAASTAVVLAVSTAAATATTSGVTGCSYTQHAGTASASSSSTAPTRDNASTSCMSRNFLYSRSNLIAAHRLTRVWERKLRPSHLGQQHRAGCGPCGHTNPEGTIQSCQRAKLESANGAAAAALRRRQITTKTNLGVRISVPGHIDSNRKCRAARDERGKTTTRNRCHRGLSHARAGVRPRRQPLVGQTDPSDQRSCSAIRAAV